VSLRKNDIYVIFRNGVPADGVSDVRSTESWCLEEDGTCRH